MLGLRELYPEHWREFEGTGGEGHFELHLHRLGVRQLGPAREAELITLGLVSYSEAAVGKLRTTPF